MVGVGVMVGVNVIVGVKVMVGVLVGRGVGVVTRFEVNEHAKLKMSKIENAVLRRTERRLMVASLEKVARL